MAGDAICKGPPGDRLRVLQFSTYDTGGGAALAAHDLHRELGRSGVNSRLAVQIRSRPDTGVMSPMQFMPNLRGRLRGYLDFAHLALRPNRQKQICFSTNALSSSSCEKAVAALDPDLLHLHWVGSGFLQIESIGRFRKPIVWTMHDSWPFTGGCHVPGACLRYGDRCGACPAMGSSSDDDLSRRIWQRKEAAWRPADMTLVSPSRWLADCARKSSLFRDRRIEVIPNGLDLQVFSAKNREEARARLGLPPDVMLIGFGATLATGDPNKGFDLLTEALKRLVPDRVPNVALAMYGHASRRAHEHVPMRVFSLGWMPRSQLPWFHSAVDVTVVPSRQENLPFSAMESLACGTPCVAFDVGGLKDLVEHEKNGYLARPYDTDDLAHGLEWILTDTPRRKALGERARRICEEAFSIQRHVSRYRALYEDVVSAHKPA